MTSRRFRVMLRSFIAKAVEQMPESPTMIEQLTVQLRALNTTLNSLLNTLNSPEQGRERALEQALNTPSELCVSTSERASKNERTTQRPRGKAVRDVLTYGFEERFWVHYPRKQAKKRALNRWMNTSEQGRERAVNDLVNRDREHRDPQWVKKFAPDGRWIIPLPSTYLGDERFNDEWEPQQTTTETQVPCPHGCGRVFVQQGTLYESHLEDCPERPAHDGRARATAV